MASEWHPSVFSGSFPHMDAIVFAYDSAFFSIVVSHVSLGDPHTPRTLLLAVSMDVE